MTKQPQTNGVNTNDKIVVVRELHKAFGGSSASSTIKENIVHPLAALRGRRQDKRASLQQVLKGISFSLEEGDFFGVVGRNGSGKSTLLKILAGIYEPDKGTVKTKGRVVPFIELGVGFNGNLTGRENVYLNGALLGFSQEEVDKKYEEIVAFAELEEAMDRKLKNYSSGMQVRLAFSIATRLAESDVLLIDEVLAVGDAEFQRKCFNYFKGLKKEKKTVILITHDMNAVREYCNKAMLINNGEVVVSGSPDRVATAYTRMFQEEDAINEELARQKKHWGSKELFFDNVAIDKTILRPEDPELGVRTSIGSSRDVDELVAGVSIMDSAGTRLFGSNNKIRQQVIRNIKSGEVIQMDWVIPNIFNEGEYTVCVSASDPDGYMYDSWDDAVPFKVYKEQSTGFPVDPQLALRVNRKRKT